MKNLAALSEILRRIKNIKLTEADISKRIISDFKLESIDVAELADEIEKTFKVNLLKSLRENPAIDANPLNFSIEELLKMINKK